VFEAPQPLSSTAVQIPAIPAQQQPAEPKQLRVGSTPAFTPSRELRPIRPGEEFIINFGVTNEDRESDGQGYVLTVTVPPEVTFISLTSVNAICDGNSCQGPSSRISAGKPTATR
jgi:hypothetical protein